MRLPGSIHHIASTLNACGSMSSVNSISLAREMSKGILQMRLCIKPDPAHGGQDLMSNKFAGNNPKASIVPPYMIGALQVLASFVVPYRHVPASRKGLLWSVMK